jgi:hypothetical protein
MRELLEPLLPIILVTLGVTATAVWVFLQSGARPVIKFILVPSTIAGALFVPLLVHGLLGFSVKAELPKDVTVMAHKVVVVANRKERIEIWGLTREVSRLYNVPYSKPLEEALQEAAEGRKNGMKSSLKHGKKGGEGSHDGDEGGPEDSYEVQLVQPDGFTAKDAPTDE